MKQKNKIIAGIAFIMITSSLYAGATIGTVYGKDKYRAYIGTGHSIYLENKRTGKICDTGLISKNKYVSTPSGRALYSKKDVLTEISRRLYRSDIRGCK